MDRHQLPDWPGLHGHSYTAEVEQIETTTMSPPMTLDQTWTETDKRGHVHDALGEGTTWHWKVRHTWINSDGDEYDDGRYECRKCHREIHPQFVPKPGWGGGFRTFMPGRTTYYRDGVEITEAEFLVAVRPTG